jgi:hypothetical protein
MNLENNHDSNFLTPAPQKAYSIRIGEHLHNRITKIIRSLKYLDNHSHTRQRWFIEAFKEKLKKEEESEVDEISADKYVGFKIDKHLSEKIEKRVGEIKKHRISFSKKQWFMEAIFEKLDRDERRTRELLNKKS